MTQLRVMVVDDHPVVRNGYRRLLESTSDIRVEAEASTGEEAYARYVQKPPDVLVIDLTLPGISGIETIRRIRLRDPSAKILVFSMHDSPVMVTRALEAGAAGYLTKSSAATEMVEAVRAVAQGRSYVSSKLIPDLVVGKAATDDPLQRLTPREFQVFLRFANGQTVAEVAELLHISPKTVGVHQTKIMRKLGVRNSAELTRLAIRYGLVNP